MLLLLEAAAVGLHVGVAPLSSRRGAPPRCVASLPRVSDPITAEEPLRVLIAGAGVGGLALANELELSEAYKVSEGFGVPSHHLHPRGTRKSSAQRGKGRA